MQHLEEVNGFSLPCCSDNNPNETRSRSFQDLRIAAISWVCWLVSRFIGGLWIFWQGFNRVGGNTLFPRMGLLSSDAFASSLACTTLPDSSHAWPHATTVTWTTSWERFSSAVVFEWTVGEVAQLPQKAQNVFSSAQTVTTADHVLIKYENLSHEGTADACRSQRREGMGGQFQNDTSHIAETTRVSLVMVSPDLYWWDHFIRCMIYMIILSALGDNGRQSWLERLLFLWLSKIAGQIHSRGWFKPLQSHNST